VSTDPGLLGGIGAAQLRARVRAGELSPSDVADAFFAAVGEDTLHAWTVIDADGLRAQARALEALSPDRREQLPLFGVPVAIKDNFDTADLPTEYGSPIYAGHRPQADAPVVARLRAAGALIAGKVKCAEFAWMSPPDTLNPLDHTRTPGGSSNGSAAAIAAGHVPLATGSQTAGSIGRPASYCGVLGYKPTFGRFARDGVKPMAPSLDTVGLFARGVEDLALAAAVLDPGSNAPPPRPATTPRPHATSTPRIAFAPTSLWAAIELEAAAAIGEAAERARTAAGIELAELDLPGYGELAAAQETIQAYESAQSLASELRTQPELLSDALRAALQAASEIPSAQYDAAKRTAAQLAPPLTDALKRYDAVLTPSTTGVPPEGLGFTGDPLFCRVWTLIGAPSLSVPLAWAPSGLPVGLQLVGAPGRDSAVLRAAAWLQESLVRPLN
jgi:Asp-tRNA(Asn)/Glu-tRNA(Gln) amidotransferase A subunit family amidase